MNARDIAATRLASQALERSRQALLQHMALTQDTHAAGQAAWPPTAQTTPGTTASAPQPEADGHPAHSALWQGMRQAASAWWQAHPARLALELAEPVFEHFARTHPLRVLAVSAATGAALVVIRPWRLMSVTGLLMAALKSTQMPALASALLRPTPTGAASGGSRESDPLSQGVQTQAARDDIHVRP